MLYNDDVDTEALQNLHLVFMREDHFGRVSGRQHLHGMRLKCQHHRRYAELPRITDGAVDQGSMSQMDAVEITQGHDVSCEGETWFIDVAKNLHTLYGRLIKAAPALVSYSAKPRMVEFKSGRAGSFTIRAISAPAVLSPPPKIADTSRPTLVKPSGR